MKLNAKRLLKLAAFLDKLPKSHFDFGIVLRRDAATDENKCGTVGCAIGWCPTVFPDACRAVPTGFGDAFGVAAKGKRYKRFAWHGPRVLGGHALAARDLFGMDIEHAEALFSPGDKSPATGRELGEEATPKQVAKRIRAYVKWAQKRAKASK